MNRKADIIHSSTIKGGDFISSSVQVSSLILCLGDEEGERVVAGMLQLSEALPTHFFLSLLERDQSVPG